MIMITAEVFLETRPFTPVPIFHREEIRGHLSKRRLGGRYPLPLLQSSSAEGLRLPSIPFLVMR